MGGAEKRIELSQQQKSMLATMGIDIWYPRPVQSEQTTEQQNALPSSAAQPEASSSMQSTAEVAQTQIQNPTKRRPVPVDPPAAVETQQAGASVDVPPSSSNEAKESVDEPSGAPVQPIEFSWIKCGNAMLVLAPESDRAVLQLAKDIALAMNWSAAPSDEQNSEQNKSATKPGLGEFRWPQLLDTGGTPSRALQVFFNKHLAADNARLGVSAELTDELIPWLSDISINVLRLPSLRQQLADPAGKKALWQILKSQA